MTLFQTVILFKVAVTSLMQTQNQSPLLALPSCLSPFGQPRRRTSVFRSRHTRRQRLWLSGRRQQPTPICPIAHLRRCSLIHKSIAVPDLPATAERPED